MRTKEQSQRYNQLYYARHREAEKKRSRDFAIRTGYPARKHEEIRKAAIASYGGRCARCGYSDWRALQFNHKNGRGAEERRNNKFKGYRMARLLLISPRDDIDLLCANCNELHRREHRLYGRGRIRE